MSPRKAIALLLLPALLLGGCGVRVPYLYKEKCAQIQVTTVPPNAVLYFRERSEPEGDSGTEAWGEFFAVGTTPFSGTIGVGYWDLRIESPGFEPVELMLRAENGKPQAYEFVLKRAP